MPSSDKEIFSAVRSDHFSVSCISSTLIHACMDMMFDTIATINKIRIGIRMRIPTITFFIAFSPYGIIF